MGNQQFYGIPAHRYANYLGENVGQYNSHDNDEQVQEEHDHMHDLLQALHPQQRQNLTIQDLQQLQRIAQLKREQEERKAERIRLAKQRKLEQLRAQQLQKQQEEAAAAAAQRDEKPQYVLVKDPHTNEIKLMQLTPRAAAAKQQKHQAQAQQKQRQQQNYVPFMQDKHFAQEWIQEMSTFAKQYPQYLPLLKKAIEEQEKSNIEKSATPLSSTPLPWSSSGANAQNVFDLAAARKKKQEEEESVTDDEKNFLNHFAALMGGLHTPTTPKKQRITQSVFDTPKKPSAQKKITFANPVQQQISGRRSGLTEQEEIENALEQYTPEELHQIRKIQLHRQQQEKQARLLQEQKRQQALLQEQQRQKELELLEQKQRQAALQEQQQRLALLKKQQREQREEPLYMFIPPRGNQPGRIVLNPTYVKKMQDEKVSNQQREQQEAAKVAAEKQKKQQELLEQEAKEAAEKRKKAHHEFFTQVPVQEILEHLQKQYEEPSSDDDEKSIEDEILEESLEELEDKWDGKSKKQIPIEFETSSAEKPAQEQPAVVQQAQQPQQPQAAESSSPQGKGPKLEKLQITADQKQNFEHETKLLKIEERINELLKELMEIGAIVSTNHGDASLVPTLRKLEDALSTQLLSLDTIVSDNEDIRKRRKQNVVRVHNLIAIVEGYMTKVTAPQQQEQAAPAEAPVVEQQAAEVQQPQQHEETGNVLVQEAPAAPAVEQPQASETQEAAPAVETAAVQQETPAEQQPAVEQATPVAEQTPQ